MVSQVESGKRLDERDQEADDSDRRRSQWLFATWRRLLHSAARWRKIDLRRRKELRKMEFASSLRLCRGLERGCLGVRTKKPPAEPGAEGVLSDSV